MYPWRLTTTVTDIVKARFQTLSSYALTLMALHFLQSGVFPPVLPCLQVNFYPRLGFLSSTYILHIFHVSSMYLPRIFYIYPPGGVTCRLQPQQSNLQPALRAAALGVQESTGWLEESISDWLEESISYWLEESISD